jgi:hypothetical protein
MKRLTIPMNDETEGLTLSVAVRAALKTGAQSANIEGDSDRFVLAPVSDEDAAAIKAAHDDVEVHNYEPLDHDGDGHKGGSLKGEDSTAHKGKVRKANPEAE